MPPFITQYEYKAASCTGNFYDAAKYVNKLHAKEGWRIVSCNFAGGTTFIMLERPIYTF